MEAHVGKFNATSGSGSSNVKSRVSELQYVFAMSLHLTASFPKTQADEAFAATGGPGIHGVIVASAGEETVFPDVGGLSFMEMRSPPWGWSMPSCLLPHAPILYTVNVENNGYVSEDGFLIIGLFPFLFAQMDVEMGGVRVSEYVASAASEA